MSCKAHQVKNYIDYLLNISGDMGMNNNFSIARWHTPQAPSHRVQITWTKKLAAFPVNLVMEKCSENDVSV